MMQELLTLLAANQADLTKTSLCRQLNVSPARLDNMLMVLEQKGRIRLALNEKVELCKQHSDCPSTGKACTGTENCILLMKMPLGIEIIADK